MQRNEQYNAQWVSRLVVKNIWGSVQLSSHGAQEVQIRIEGDDTSVQEVIVRHENGELLVQQPNLLFGLDALFRPGKKLSVEIILPETWQGDVSLNTVSGKISARQVQAVNLSMETVSGAISCFGLSARQLKIQTVAGNIDASSLHTDRLDLRAVSGDMRLTGLMADDVKGTAVSGATELSFEQPFRTVELTGVSGAITLETPSPQLAVAFHAVSGRVQYGGEMVQGNAPRVSVSMVSGNLTIYNTQQG